MIVRLDSTSLQSIELAMQEKREYLQCSHSIIHESIRLTTQESREYTQLRSEWGNDISVFHESIELAIQEKTRIYSLVTLYHP